ncbi:MAG: WecB/TagA/CpsF family glycosyltransferase [Lachnospiraceae bacterium]
MSKILKKPFTNRILGVNIAVTCMEESVKLILSQLQELKGEFICLSNVHTTVMAKGNEEYRNIQNSAFLALPDGSPLALVQRLRGYKTAEQVPGPDIMPALWKATEKTKIKHYFYGSSPETIAALGKKLKEQYPGLNIAGMESPPFRPLTQEEDQEAINRINASGADILWVGLGAPKQEEWMYAHRGKIKALMLGVGAGFDFHAGTVKRAPEWMRTHYLEWLYRLIQDPKRLWKRYIVTNAKFLLFSVGDAFTWKKYIDSSKKNLLIYAHYYYPDVASTGQILTELAEGLKDSFHITVICTVPSYTGTVSRYYRKHKYYYENINDVDVLRIRVPEFRKNFTLSRIFNILSYFFSAVFATFRVERQDYIFTISQPPVLGGLLGVIGKWIKKAKLIYNIQDFNPEQVKAVEYTGSRLILDSMMLLDKFSCRQADRVIVVGRDMIETLNRRFPQGDIPAYTYINNWINEEEIIPLPTRHTRVADFKERYGLKDKYVIMYSGNIGLYYDLLNIVQLVGKFQDRKDVVFAFVGGGSVLEELQETVSREEIRNVIFIPYQNKNDLVYSLNAADVHFVVNAKGIKGVSVPSKLYGVMAAGKPVLGILEKGSEARLIVEEARCGISVEPGDYEAIENLIDYYISLKDTAEPEEMGARGRSYLLQHLTKNVSIRKYKEEILSL